MGIHIFSLLSESYIQKKDSVDDNTRKNYTEFINFKSFLRKKVIVFIQGELIIQSINMNNIKIKINKKILKEICEKYDGAEDFINDRIKEICSHQKLFAEEVTYFLVSFFTVYFSR